MIHPATIGVIAGARRSVGGPDVWYDIEEVADTDADGTTSYSDVEWYPITIGQAGLCTKARLYVSFRYDTCQLRLGLYSSAGSKLADGFAASVGANQYLEVTFGTPCDVLAATYYLAAQTDKWGLGNRYTSGAGQLNWAANTYSSGLPATLPTAAGSIARAIAGSVYVD